MRFYTSVIQRGNSLLVREIRDGSRVSYRVKDWGPKFYVSSPVETDFMDEHGSPLQEVQLDSISEARDFLDQYRDVDNFSVHGTTSYTNQFISDNYKGEIKFDASLIRLFNIDIEVASDAGFPYADKAEHPVISIALYDNLTDTYYVWGLGSYDNRRDDVIYHECTSEAQLLRKFVDFWYNNHPDVVTGWNINGFDIPYLINRITRIHGESEAKRLSPWAIVREQIKRNQYGQEEQTFDIVGVAKLDYLELYKKYTYTAQEAYTLGHIGYVELGEAKLDYSEEGTLHNLYKVNFQKFIDYNIKDVELVKRLDDRMQLIDLVFTLAYFTKQNYVETFSPVRSWESMIYNWNRDRGIFCKVKSSRSNEKVQIAGAYVKEVVPSVHDWVVSCDLNSLYPHLIMQYNLGADTLDETRSEGVEEYIENYLKHPDKASKDRQNEIRIAPLVNGTKDLSFLDDIDRTMAANGTFYRKDKQSMFSCLMEELYAQRKITKKQMLAAMQAKEQASDPDEIARLEKLIAALNNKQMAIKILLNSGYGAIANKYFQFFDPRVAEAVTLSGQLSIKWIEERLNRYLNEILGTKNVNYVVYCDTDSAYIELKALVQRVYGDNIPQEDYTKVVDFLDKAIKGKIEPFIKDSYEELAQYMHAYRNAMVMEREVIASRGFWTAKKRYALMVYDSEGVRYAQPKPKIMGLEVVKSSTPEFCRKALKEAIVLVLQKENSDVIEYIEKVRKDFMKLRPSEAASPRSVSGVSKYADPEGNPRKGTPKHVKGALLYNKLIKKHGLRHLAPVKEGEKIKFLDLKEPNPTFQSVIAFPSSGELPSEFELDKYVNYRAQFDLTFMSPIETILETVGWKAKEEVSLMSFFS